jgi:hypothetical protein
MHESPRQNRVDPWSIRHLLNWTLNYRRDATIPVPYGYLTTKESPATDSQHAEALSMSSINYAAGRTKKIAWFVSNCGSTRNGRINYFTELNK